MKQFIEHTKGRKHYPRAFEEDGVFWEGERFVVEGGELKGAWYVSTDTLHYNERGLIDRKPDGT